MFRGAIELALTGTHSGNLRGPLGQERLPKSKVVKKFVRQFFGRQGSPTLFEIAYTFSQNHQRKNISFQLVSIDAMYRLHLDLDHAGSHADNQSTASGIVSLDAYTIRTSWEEVGA
jgi:hypothetical protein